MTAPLADRDACGCYSWSAHDLEAPDRLAAACPAHRERYVAHLTRYAIGQLDAELDELLRSRPLSATAIEMNRARLAR